MLAKRVLGGYAIFVASLAAIAALAAMLLSHPVVLGVLAKVFRPEMDFAPVTLGLGCFATLAGFWCIVLVSIAGCVPQEMIPPVRLGRTNNRLDQGLEVEAVAIPPQSRHGTLLRS